MSNEATWLYGKRSLISSVYVLQVETVGQAVTLRCFPAIHSVSNLPLFTHCSKIWRSYSEDSIYRWAISYDIPFAIHRSHLMSDLFSFSSFFLSHALNSFNLDGFFGKNVFTENRVTLWNCDLQHKLAYWHFVEKLIGDVLNRLPSLHSFSSPFLVSK